MPRKAAVHLAFGVFALLEVAQVVRFGGFERWPGAALALACLALVHYSADALCERSPAWLLAGGWLVACTPFAFWAAVSPDVAASALFALGAALLLHRGRAVPAALACAALAALQPHGVLFAPAVGAQGLWMRRRDGEEPAWLRPFARASLLATPLAALHWVVPKLASLPAGAGAVAYLHDALAGYLPVPVIVLAVASLSFRGGEGALFAVPPALGVAPIMYVMACGGDPAPLYRPFMTVVPLAFLLAAAGLETVLGLIGPFLSGLDRGAAVVGVLVCALQLHHVPAEHAPGVLKSRERKTSAIFWNSPP